MTEPVPSFGLGRLPRIAFGAGVFEQVPTIAAKHGARAFLVTGGRSFNDSPRRARLENGLVEASVTLVGSTTVRGEPGPADV